MALQTSGQISLNDIHVEAGGASVSGTACNINEADIRGLISASSGAAMDFADWYGASASQDFTTVKSGHTYHTYTGGRGSTQYGFAVGFNSPAAATGGSTPPSGSISYTGDIVVSGTTLGTIAEISHRTVLLARQRITIKITGTNTNSGWTTVTFTQGSDTYSLNRTAMGYTYSSGQRVYTSADLFASDSSHTGSGTSFDSAILGPGTGSSAGTGTESSFTTTVTFS